MTPELEQFVQEKVASGLYYSASEVIREGLRLLKEREELQRVRLQEVRLQEVRLQEVRLQELRQDSRVESDDVELADLANHEATPLNPTEAKKKTRPRRQRRIPQ